MKQPLLLLLGFATTLSFSQDFHYEGFYPEERIYEMEVATILDLEECIDGFVKGERNEKEELMYMGSFEGWSRFHYQTRIEEKGRETIWTSQKHFRVKDLNFQIKGTNEEIKNGSFFPVAQVVEEKNLLILTNNRIKIQNQSVDTTRVSTRRYSNTPDTLNLNQTFEH